MSLLQCPAGCVGAGESRARSKSRNRRPFARLAGRPDVASLGQGGDARMLGAESRRCPRDTTIRFRDRRERSRDKPRHVRDKPSCNRDINHSGMRRPERPSRCPGSGSRCPGSGSRCPGSVSRCPGSALPMSRERFPMSRERFPMSRERFRVRANPQLGWGSVVRGRSLTKSTAITRVRRVERSAHRLIHVFARAPRAPASRTPRATPRAASPPPRPR